MSVAPKLAARARRGNDKCSARSADSCRNVAEINAHTHSFASAPAALRELATRRNRHVWETWIICRQFNQPAETNVFGMAGRQSTSAGSCTRLLHCVLARATGSLAPGNRRFPFPQRSRRGLAKSDGTNELLFG